MYNRYLVPACLGLSLAALPTLGQDVGKDVPPTHWAYMAVQDLASKGLIQGYPPDSKFLGGRVMTRYEMAAIIERVLKQMDDMVSKANKGETVSKADMDKLAASLKEITDLTEEFKKELLVIGTDLSKAKDDITALKAQLDALSTKVDSFDARLIAAQKRADEANTLIDQLIENINEIKTNAAATNAELERKVAIDDRDKAFRDNIDSDTGKKYRLRIFGDIQTWYLNPLGGTAGGSAPLNTSSAPVGRNYNGGVGDYFRIRRAELGFKGNIDPRVDYYFLFDLGKIGNLSTTSATVAGTSVITSASANAANDILQDAWIGYQITPRLRVEAGAQKTGMSEEGNRSSIGLYTIERSIMNGLPTNAGRIGYIRDTGAVLRYKVQAKKATLGDINIGIWNDNGPTQNTVDNDRTKFFNVVANYTGTRHLIAGVFGGTNVDNVHPKPSRDRAGFTLMYENGRHFIEAEGAYTLDQSATNGIAGRSIGLGGYALYAYSINRKWQLVAKYDEWDPAVHGSVAGGVALGGAANHNLREYTFGINYYLTGTGTYRTSNSKLQLNFIDEDAQHNGYAFWGIRRQIILSNYSVGF